MKQIVTSGIVLTRTNFGEADRIVTILTPDHGKIRVMAKGVRKIKSKLAGGVELFSVSSITYIPGKKGIQTLVSARLQKHFGNLVNDLDATMYAYDLIKRTNKATEDEAEPGYFTALETVLNALNEGTSQDLIELWFSARLLMLGGLQPNLTHDTTGARLQVERHYTFDFDHMAFHSAEQGSFTADHIKFLRLAFGLEDPAQLQQVKDARAVLGPCLQLVKSLQNQHTA